MEKTQDVPLFASVDDALMHAYNYRPGSPSTPMMRLTQRQAVVQASGKVGMTKLDWAAQAGMIKQRVIRCLSPVQAAVIEVHYTRDNGPQIDKGLLPAYTTLLDYCDSAGLLAGLSPGHKLLMARAALKRSRVVITDCGLSVRLMQMRKRATQTALTAVYDTAMRILDDALVGCVGASVA